ncbi:MAG: hypothetical protein ABIS47_01430 [Acidimicrobiales bacterium]
MLTQRGAGPSTRGRGARRAVLAPTARLAHPGLVSLTVGLAALPTIITLCWRGDDLFAPLVVAGLVSGAALGWAVDDPAAELLASTPAGTPLRTAIRVGAVALVAAVGFGGLLAAVAIGPGLPPQVGDRRAEAAAAGATALAIGLIAARRGERAAGAAAVTAGVLGPATVAGLSFKLRQLPSLLPGPHHDRWWLLALAGLVVALHAGRDPARR